MSHSIEEEIKAFHQRIESLNDASTRRRNKKPNKAALQSLVKEWLHQMDINSDETILEEKKAFYEAAGMPEYIFGNSFTTWDSILIWIKITLLEDCRDSIKASTDLEAVLFRIFRRYLEKPEIACLWEFAARRFGSEFWRTVLEPAETILYPVWGRYGAAVADELCGLFVSQFRSVYALWIKNGAQHERIKTCIDLLLAYKAHLETQVVRIGMIKSIFQGFTNNTPIDVNPVM